MKKVVSLICAAALAVLCAVPAFAEDATAGSASNNAAVSIIESANKATDECKENVQTIVDAANANPSEPLTNEQVDAMAGVVNDIIKAEPEANAMVKVAASETVANPVSFQTVYENKITNVSLTKQDDKTLVLSADWGAEGGEPEYPILVGVSGLQSGAAYQLVRVKEERATYSAPVTCVNGVVSFVVPGFSSYEIVRVKDASAEGTTASTVTASSTVDAAKIDAEFYTCPACGYHNWTGVNGGYKCDNCGHIEYKDLSGYPNVKGTATLTAGTATKSAANPIKATSANLDMVVLFVLAVAAAVVGGGALVVKKQGLGK